jgi:uncharacterized protein (DUF1778 family)
MGTKALKKEEILSMRVTSETKEIIARAASVKGQDVTSYVMGLAVDQAFKDIKSHREVERILMSSEDFDDIQAEITKPSEPNAHLKASAKRFKEKNL